MNYNKLMNVTAATQFFVAALFSIETVQAAEFTLCVRNNVGSNVFFKGAVAETSWTCQGNLSTVNSPLQGPSGTYPNCYGKDCSKTPPSGKPNCMTIHALTGDVTPGARVEIWADDRYNNKFKNRCTVYGSFPENPPNIPTVYFEINHPYGFSCKQVPS